MTELLARLSELQNQGLVSKIDPRPELGAVRVVANSEGFALLESLPHVTRVTAANKETEQAAAQAFERFSGSTATGDANEGTPQSRVTASTNPSVFVDPYAKIWGATTPNTQVMVTATSQSGKSRFRQQTQADSYGNYEVSLGTTDLATGDTVSVTAAGRTENVAVENLEIHVDIDQDRVWGKVPPNRTVSTNVVYIEFLSYCAERIFKPPDRQTTSDSRGNFSISWADLTDFGPGDRVTVSILLPNGNGLVTDRSAHSTRVDRRYSLVAGDRDPGDELIVILQDSTGSVKEVHAAIASKSGSWFVFFDSEMVERDKIRIQWRGTTSIIEVMQIALEIDANGDTVSGVCTKAGARVSISVSHRYDLDLGQSSRLCFGVEAQADATGRFHVNLASRVDLVPGDRVFAHIKEPYGDVASAEQSVPLVYVAKDTGLVWGDVTEESSLMTITVRRADGSVKGIAIPVISDGSFATFVYRTLWDRTTPIEINAGDVVEVRAGAPRTDSLAVDLSVTVPEFTAVESVGSSTITGIAPPNATLYVWNEEWWGSSNSGPSDPSIVTSDADGHYTISLGSEAERCDYATIIYVNPQGHAIRLLASTDFQDPFEPDNSREQATLVTVGDSPQGTHNLHTTGDMDWFRFHAEAGQCYIIRSTSTNRHTDPTPMLYTATGKRPIAHARGLEGLISWDAAESTDCFVVVQSYGFGCDSTYEIQITSGEQCGSDLAADVEAFVGASRQDIEDTNGLLIDIGWIGDYYVDQLQEDRVKTVFDLGLKVFLLASGVVHTNWSLVNRGLNNVANPGYQAALHASWRGWVDDPVTKHWYKPLYDSIHNNGKLVFKQVVSAGMQYFAREGLQAKLEDVTTDLLTKTVLGVSHRLPDYPFTDSWVSVFQRLGEGYGTDLQREQEQLIQWLGTQTLTEDQAAAYRADLAARQQANQKIVEQLTLQHDLLQHSYEAARRSRNEWVQTWPPMLFRLVVVTAATLQSDGAGYYLASKATAGVDLMYSWVMDLRTLDNDQMMLDQALRFLTGGASLTYMRISQNTVNALNLMRAREMPKIAGAQVRVEEMRSDGNLYSDPNDQVSWVELDSVLNLSIRNTNPFTTTYLPAIAYDFDGERIVANGQALELAGNSQGTVVLPIRSASWGLGVKSGDEVELTVLGTTETGTYAVVTDMDVVWAPVGSWATPEVRHMGAAWNPQMPRLATGPFHNDQKTLTAEQMAQIPVVFHPLTAVTTRAPDSIDYERIIMAVNPFTVTLQATITQTLPADVEVLDAGGAKVDGRSLVWTNSLEPKATVWLKAVLRWPGIPGQAVSMPGPRLVLGYPTRNWEGIFVFPDAPLSAAWPLDTSVEWPDHWEMNKAVSVPISLTNSSPSIAAQGAITVSLSMADGAALWSTVQEVNIPAGGTQELTLSIPATGKMGYVLFSGEAALGQAKEVVFEELVYIDGMPVYLPIAFPRTLR